MSSHPSEKPENGEASEVEHNVVPASPEKSTDLDDFSDEDRKGREFTIDDVALPKGYYYSVSFLGSFFAMGMSLTAGVGGFSFVAPILSTIDSDIGPDPNITWVALTYTLTGAVGFMIVGRVTDLFGRRWIFTGGSAIGTLGSIIGAVAPNVPALIAGMTLIGLAQATQITYYYSLGELVPMKYRFLANGAVYLFIIPTSGLASKIAYDFLNTSAGWRGVFYLLIAMNAVSTLSWFFFYHPPTFNMKHGPGRKMQFIKDFDYVGTFLATLGLLLFLMGLSWGGGLYPWKSAHVIVTIVVGFLIIVAFFLWEIYIPLKEPLLPKNFMRNRDWILSVMVWSLGSTLYYAFAIVWPEMITVLYENGRQGWAGWAASVVGAGFTLGEILGGFSRGQGTKYQIIFAFSVGSILYACMATCTKDTPGRAVGLLMAGSTLIGYNEVINSVVSSICIEDQREIGTAIGLGGSLRQTLGTIAATVYTVVLTNRLATTIPAQVPGALVKAGLPSTSVAAWLEAFTVGTSAAFAGVPGITPQIIEIGTEAYKTASMDAYRTVFFTTIAFSGVGIIMTFFLPDVGKKMNHEVAVTLHDARHEDTIVGEKHHEKGGEAGL